jgi:hypothetical protein
MAASKRSRFEVFKRDGFKCQYCGRTPPDIVLELDHIQPKCKGGPDDINNYITSCFDCNRGKAGKSLKDLPKTLKVNLADLQEREMQITEYNKLLHSKQKRVQSFINKFHKSMAEHGADEAIGDFRPVSLRLFLERLPESEIIDAFDIAWLKICPPGKEQYNSIALYKYFCGVCWHKVSARQGDEG